MLTICGYPGIGKSYLERHNDKFEDSWFSEHYYLDKAKGIVNPEFPANYIHTISRIMQEGKIILTGCSDEARKLFYTLGIPYLLVYPGELEIERYFEIYDTRPDVREWISLNKKVWYPKLRKLYRFTVPIDCFKAEIPRGMNLTQYLQHVGYLLELVLWPNAKRGKGLIDYQHFKPGAYSKRSQAFSRMSREKTVFSC